MRKFVVGAALMVWLAVLVAPATAAPVRDPFRSPISTVPGSEAPGTTTTDTSISGSVPFTPSDEQTPNTGFDASTWLGVAYALLAVGAGALVLSRQLGPPARR